MRRGHGRAALCRNVPVTFTLELMKDRVRLDPLRFAAKLLFQYRVVADGQSNVMRTCEERIVLFEASTARAALKLAKKHGNDAQHRYENGEGGFVHFEFVGVMDLLHLGAECEEGEVWYEISRRKLPKERAGTILPKEAELNAVRHEL